MRYFRNAGDGTFVEATEEAGLTGLVGGLNLMQTDFNNDGYADVLVLRGAWFRSEGHHPNSLIRNNGDGTFTDVTKESGLLSFHPTQTAAWFDANNDGWIDLFIGNESTTEDVNPCELYINNGDGTFQDHAKAMGVAITDGIIKVLPQGTLIMTDGRISMSPSVTAITASFAILGARGVTMRSPRFQRLPM